MRALACTILALAACDAGDIGCRIDVECGDAQVCVAGQCVQRGDVSSGPTMSDGGVTADLAEPTTAPDGFSPDALSSCPFNNDGIIQRAEIPAMPGLGGFFIAAPSNQTTSVDLTKQAGGWDFSGSKPGDQKVFDGLSSPSGAWWAAQFPDATYAQLLDAATGYLGIYKIDDTHLYLLGAVSPTNAVPYSELTYNPPIDVLRFPLANGDHWTVSTSLSGVASGIAFYATETWTMSADDSGKAKTPAATFDTLRLRIDYQQTYGFAVTTNISYLFLAECYGVVTRIRSTTGETNASFTQASEYRRLAAP